MSPAMHNAAYAALKMNRAYLAFRVRPENLAAALDAIPALGIIGVNLTVPHKENAARRIKNLSAEARLLGAVNCVANRRETLLGDNTDARGLEIDLRENHAAIAGGIAIVIGAGGAAAAAVLACIRMRAAHIIIANRTISRARALVRRMTPQAGRTSLEARGLEAAADRMLVANARAIINASAMGLATRRFAPVAYDASPADCLFYDLIYSAKPTAFLAPAMRSRRRAIDGAGMLANQGELAFKLFNGVAPPRGVMRAALMNRLSRI